LASLKNIDLSHLIGQDVGSSTLLEEIARGSMGAVFAGYQKTLKRQIAIKILPKAIITDLTSKIFQQEAELAARLSHPNIIPVYEVGDAGDFLFLAMQLVKGEPLSEHIQMALKNLLHSKRTMPLNVTFKFIVSILDALEYAHQNSIVHRDIKPGNILVENHNNRPMIVDFGLAQATQKPDETGRVSVGTPLYMAPEQIFNPEVDGRADIYAAATMLYEMLTPVPLFPDINSSSELLRAKLNPKANLFVKMPSEMNSELNIEIDRILFNALASEPENRYGSCHEFREKLYGYYKKYHGRLDDNI
jgi:serine/threonine-protein kinase